MTQLAPEPTAAGSATPPTPDKERGATVRGQADTLAIAWIHGAFHAATYRRGNLVSSWSAEQDIGDLNTFGKAVDEALEATRFKGTDTIILLAHESFSHQTEACPSFSENATRSYLRGRVERFEQEHGPVLSVSQPVARVRQEAQHLLHLLPRTFYLELHEILLSRHLDLTRIIPTSVPLQLEIRNLTGDRESPLLMAVRMGHSTAVLACRENGEILLSRTTLSSWTEDPDRVAVEVNRSLLYAKQQHGVDIDRIVLAGPGADGIKPAIEARCGEGRELVFSKGSPVDWLSLVVKLPPRHPVNLVAGYLNTKRRNQFLRRVILATCWLVLLFLIFDTWARDQIWASERDRLIELSARQPELQDEYDRLVDRNATAEQDQAFIREVVENRLPPVPDRFLAYVASILPRDVRLSFFSVTWNDEQLQWRFRIDGMLETDPETARITVNALRRELSQSALKVRFTESVRAEVELNLSTETAAQPFSLEGVLFEH